MQGDHARTPSAQLLPVVAAPRGAHTGSVSVRGVSVSGVSVVYYVGVRSESVRVASVRGLSARAV